MKKIIFALIVIFTTTNIFAQEKGLYLFLGGNAGKTNFNYKLEGGNPKPDLGYGASIGAQYYFNQYLGCSFGLDVSIFNTQSYFTRNANRERDPRFVFKGVPDKEGDLCDLNILLHDWTEKQRTYFLDIPLLMKFQHKWGKKEIYGFYMGMGLKFQIPVASNYKKSEGELEVYAYYPEWELPLGWDVPLPWLGLGTNDKNAWGGKNHFKMGCAIHGEAGFLIGLGKRVDLTLGISADYGFANIKKNSDPLVDIVKDRTPQDGAVGDIAIYNGVLNSNKTATVNPLSVRANVGLRIKLGKLQGKSDTDDPTKKMTEILSNIEKNMGRRDTIIVNPVVLPVYLPASQDDGQEGVRVREWSNDNSGNNYGNNSGSTNNNGSTIRVVKKGEPVPQTIVNELEESVYFALNSADLDNTALGVLDRKIAHMKKYPSATLSIIGHTCDLGSGTVNDELSHNRAAAARYYMISKGIKPSRIEIISMGKHYPTYPNSTEESRRLNRRVDFILND